MDMKTRIESQLDYCSEQIKRVEGIKSRCLETIAGCDKLISEMNESIKDLKESLKGLR